MNRTVPIPDIPARDMAADTSLWGAFARSVRHNIVAEVAIQTLRVSGMIILARQLTPGDFGLFKILLVISVFASVANEAGVPDALIQRKDLRPEHESTAWWMSLGVAALIASALYLGAPLVAFGMAMPRLVFGVRLLCIPLLLEGTVVTASARLRRRLQFGALALADVIAEIVFLAVALIVLWREGAEWSLPAALAARFAAHAVSIWIADPHPAFGLPRLQAARDLARFAASVSGGRLVYVLSSNADYLLVGRLLGSTALGFYTIAWDLLRFVPDRLHKVVGRVTLPVFCHFQDDDQELARAYRDFFGYVARIVLPLAACVVVAAPELISSVYGNQWLPAAEPLRLLASGLALAGLRVGIGSIYYSKDHPSFDLYLHGSRLILIIIVCVAFAHTGLIGVSAAMSAVEGTISIAGGWMACRLVGMRLEDLARATTPGIRVAFVCAMGTAAGKLAASQLGLEGPLVLAAIIPPAVFAYCWFEAPTVIRMVAGAFGCVAGEGAMNLSPGVK